VVGIWRYARFPVLGALIAFSVATVVCAVLLWTAPNTWMVPDQPAPWEALLAGAFFGVMFAAGPGALAGCVVLVAVRALQGRSRSAAEP
jgi:hypothetical protein